MSKHPSRDCENLECGTDEIQGSSCAGGAWPVLQFRHRSCTRPETLYSVWPRYRQLHQYTYICLPGTSVHRSDWRNYMGHIFMLVWDLSPEIEADSIVVYAYQPCSHLHHVHLQQCLQLIKTQGFRSLFWWLLRHFFTRMKNHCVVQIQLTLK